MSSKPSGRSASSQRWLKRQSQDPYVKQAKQAGYRSRASYKLKEIQDKDRLIKRGSCVLDLGAAPGGWSQCLPAWVGDQGCVVACDLLPMDSIAGVQFVQGDFTDADTQASILAALDGRAIDVMVSDLAPNTMGVRQADQWAAMGLLEEVLWFAKQHLRRGGHLLVKAFHGSGSEELLRELRVHFQTVKTRKPSASRSRSREVYWLAYNHLNETQPSHEA